jgi:hypothetical protein
MQRVWVLVLCPRPHQRVCPLETRFFVSIQQVAATCSSMIRTCESLTSGIEWLQPFYAEKLENNEYLFSREGNGFPKGTPFGGVWDKAPVYVRRVSYCVIFVLGR